MLDKNEENEKIKKQFRKVINKNIETVIRRSMGYGANSTEPLRRKITFQELIDYKFKSKTDDEKFQIFVTLVENIIENIKLMFPFINLEGIDLTWTINELQNKIFEIFENTPEMNLTNCPRLSEEERKQIRKKKSQLQKELEAKLENEIRRVFNIPADEKIQRRLYLINFIEDYVPENKRKEIEKYIEYTWERNSYFSKRIKSQFELDLIKIFPEVKEFKTYSYTRFMDLMREIKQAYKID